LSCEAALGLAVCLLEGEEEAPRPGETEEVLDLLGLATDPLEAVLALARLLKVDPLRRSGDPDWLRDLPATLSLLLLLSWGLLTLLVLLAGV